MSNILQFPQAVSNDELDQIHWMININQDVTELTTAFWNKDYWCCGIFTNSFDRLPALKEEALHKLKIAKALEGGAVQ